MWPSHIGLLNTKIIFKHFSFFEIYIFELGIETIYETYKENLFILHQVLYYNQMYNILDWTNYELKI